MPEEREKMLIKFADQTLKIFAKGAAANLHEDLQAVTAGEPLDGDATEYMAEIFLKELNKLNANI